MTEFKKKNVKIVKIYKNVFLQPFASLKSNRVTKLLNKPTTTNKPKQKQKGDWKLARKMTEHDYDSLATLTGKV